MDREQAIARVYEREDIGPSEKAILTVAILNGNNVHKCYLGTSDMARLSGLSRNGFAGILNNLIDRELMVRHMKKPSYYVPWPYTEEYGVPSSPLEQNTRLYMNIRHINYLRKLCESEGSHLLIWADAAKDRRDMAEYKRYTQLIDMNVETSEILDRHLERHKDKLDTPIPQ